MYILLDVDLIKIIKKDSLMRMVNILFIKIFNRFIGNDRYGNKYYESNRKSDYLGRKKRYIIYAKDCVHAIIDPTWHSWIHYIEDNPPIDSTSSLKWIKEREANYTGTELAYSPKSFNNKKTKYTSFKP